MENSIKNIDSEFEFPHELLIQPSALVGVSGLDTLNNAIHRSIWDALTNGRNQDKPPISFKQIGAGHDFPQPKAKRIQYDTHIPKGILKRTWMSKHLAHVPAVIAVFYDLDWDDPLWEEKKIECSSRVKSIRVALGGRDTKMCVVLIQRNVPLASGEDLEATEKALALIQASELTNKALYILPHSDNMQALITRIEQAFYDLASNYYMHACKYVSLHREHLNKKTHQYLYVRHQFKMGFFQEIRQDISAAHRCYLEAYNQLKDVRITDTNDFEVKTIAGYITYKVCKMLFILNKPRDAISNFKSLIDHYRREEGLPSLLFQHHAWISKQYSMFAELFDEMVHRGSVASQTQHPGYYYELAAKTARDRRRLCLLLCNKSNSYPESDPLVGKDVLEFYGQRPWRQCQLSAEPLDPDRERQGIQALQYIEKNHVNHSDIIIGLYGSAISQFKTYRCPRMRRHLVIQMADEYFLARDYGRSLTLVTHMLWDYRAERWGLILNSLLQLALISAYITASLPDYVSLAVEIASRHIKDHSIRAHNNLVQLVKGLPLEPEPNVSESDVKAASQLWSQVKFDNPITIDAANICCAIHCKATIVKESYNDVELKVAVKCDLPETLAFTKLSLYLSNGTGIVECPVPTNDLAFGPNTVKVYCCHYKPAPQDISKLIHISSVLLTLQGSLGSIHFKFSGLGTENINVHPDMYQFRYVAKHLSEYVSMRPVLSRIIPRRPPKVELSFNYRSPALLQEWFRIGIVVKSLEEEEITDATMTISLSNDTAVEHLTDVCQTLGQLISLPLTIKYETIKPGDEILQEIFIKASNLGVRHFDVKLSYQVANSVCVEEQPLPVKVSDVFSVSAKYLNLRFQKIEECLYSDEPFILLTNLTPLSPWPIKIHSTYFRLSDGVKHVDDYKCLLTNNVLVEGESASCIACISTTVPSDTPTHIADLILSWSRVDDPTLPKTVTVQVLPSVPKVVKSLLKISLSAPNKGTVRALLPITYTLVNCTGSLFTLHLTMESSEAFMFSGYKDVVLHLLPKSKKELQYNLYPLMCGTIRLPRLQLMSSVESLPQSYVSQLLERCIPPSVFVLPHSRIDPSEARRVGEETESDGILTT